MDKNTVSFQSPLHQNLWRSSINVLPLERTTAWITDENLLTSCRQLYSYVMDAYDDILENPQLYGLDPHNLPNSFVSDRTQFHLSILYSRKSFLELAVVKKSDCLILNTADYDKLLKDVKNKKYNSQKVFEQKEDVDRLFGTLPRRGYVIERGETQTVIRNTKYPQMFLSANLLFEACIKYYQRTKRSPQFFNLLDFREIQQDKRRWEVEDIIYGLYDTQKANVYRLIDYLSQKVKLGCSCKIWYYRTAEFTYKRKKLFLIRWGKSYAFDISLPVIPPDTEQYRLFEEELNKLPKGEELREFYFSHILTCQFCSQHCIKNNAYKKDWKFFGCPLDRLIRSCEQCVMVYDFNEENYRIFQTLLDLYLKIWDK